MTTIYFIRHAEAEGNLYRIAHGQYNSLLTTRGWKQVALVQERFANIHIDAVYASDLYRTCATASSIFQSHNLPLNRDKRLREVCVGVWEGHTWGELNRLNPEQIYNFSHDLFHWKVEGGEDPTAIIARMEAAVREIAANHPNQTVALFSHGYAIRLLLAHLQGLGLADFDKTPTGGNTAVSCLEVEGDTITIQFRDDESHLEALNKGIVRPTAVQPGAWFESVEPSVINNHFGTALADGLCLLARRKEEVMGFVQLLTQREEAQGCIGALYLAPAYRNQGYGAQLLGQAVSIYRTMGRDTLYMEETGMDEAFFLRYGFTQGQAGVWVMENKFDTLYL